MRPPQLAGVVERRLLVNYRIDADIAAGLLPAPFRPQVVRGHAVAGICFIRLGRLRPVGLPARVGLRTENAAHRIAVEWDDKDGVARTGVYIPRRHSSSRLTTLVGGRLFPGDHVRARFHVDEADEADEAGGQRVDVAFASLDGETSVDVATRVASEFTSELFDGVNEASEFFRKDAVGYSATRRCDECDGLELRTAAWSVVPAAVERARSSFFDDPHRFPPGSAELDSALLMRGVPVTWHPLERLHAPTPRSARSVLA